MLRYSTATQTLTLPVQTTDRYCFEVVDTRLAGSTWSYDSNVGAPEENVSRPVTRDC